MAGVEVMLDELNYATPKRALEAYAKMEKMKVSKWHISKCGPDYWFAFRIMDGIRIEYVTPTFRQMVELLAIK